jgi:inorganic pyrophosphatase
LGILLASQADVTSILAVLVISTSPALQAAKPLPRTLPAEATAQLAESIAAAEPHDAHVWFDTPPVNADSTINVYVEIPRGERSKWELDMAKNARAVDRLIPEEIGPYPVNYGFVPQTVFYDGDPFDALVLGPPIDGGTTIRAVIVGVMFMEDEKGLDSKVVVSPIDSGGRARYELTDAGMKRIGDYFDGYKRLEPGKFSDVPGWGTVADGRAHVDLAHAFFTRCARVEGACTIQQ